MRRLCLGQRAQWMRNDRNLEESWAETPPYKAWKAYDKEFGFYSQSEDAINEFLVVKIYGLTHLF